MSMRVVVDNERVTVRSGSAADAPALLALISAHAEEGHLLPRSLGELSVRSPQFVVVERAGRLMECNGRSSRGSSVGTARNLRPERSGRHDRISGYAPLVGCAELAPLSLDVAEVRALVVDRHARGKGLGLRMVEELSRRARRDGFDRLCAFAHDAGFFVRLGFSIVPHIWLPEKIARDCAGCALFQSCGQQALVRSVRDQPRRELSRETAAVSVRPHAY